MKPRLAGFVALLLNKSTDCVCCIKHAGNKAADEERIHIRVFQRQEVHVCVLHRQQSPLIGIQDVCQGRLHPIISDACLRS